MNLYLIRHGECLGQSDPAHYSNPDSPLSALGEQQAVLTAKHLSRANLSCVVSSPLVRALATAAPIAQSFNIPVLVWTDIREGFSDYHKGFSLAKLRTEFPNTQFSEEVTEEGWHHGNDFYDDWEIRCKRVLEKLALLPQNSQVAMITHGGFGNYFLHSVLGLSFKQPIWFELANGSVSHLRFVPNPKDERPNWPLYPPVSIEVHSINTIAHLGMT